MFPVGTALLLYLRKELERNSLHQIVQHLFYSNAS